MTPTLPNRLTGYPAHAWTLAVMFGAGGLAATAATVLPMSPAAPHALHAATAVVCLVLAGTVLTCGRRLSLTAAFGGLLISITMTSVLVATARTTGGAVLAASVYMWQAIYAAFFFSRRTAWAVLLLEVVLLGVALHVSGLPHMGTPWVAKSLSFVAAVEVHSRIVARLRQRADTDPLTDLPNRNGLVRAAERELARVARTGSRLAVAVIDLDGFKKVNDTLGHAAGDQLLVTIATAWSKVLRPTDVLARHGGDEFVLLLPGAGAAEATTVLHRLLRANADIGWSYGLTAYEPGDTLDRLLARADVRLYDAKAARTPPTSSPLCAQVSPGAMAV